MKMVGSRESTDAGQTNNSLTSQRSSTYRPPALQPPDHPYCCNIRIPCRSSRLPSELCAHNIVVIPCVHADKGWDGVFDIANHKVQNGLTKDTACQGKAHAPATPTTTHLPIRRRVQLDPIQRWLIHRSEVQGNPLNLRRHRRPISSNRWPRIMPRYRS